MKEREGEGGRDGGKEKERGEEREGEYLDMGREWKGL